VGSGRSSLGHVSARIDDISFSFGENGLDIEEFDKFVARQSFRSGRGLVLDIPAPLIAAMQRFMVSYNKPYDHLPNTCTSFQAQSLDSISGVLSYGSLNERMGAAILPGDLDFLVRNNFKVIKETIYARNPK
jgi:hypothetical protein